MRYVNLVTAALIAIFFLVFPFLNPCSGELLLCKDTIDGLTVVDYYGLKLYLP